MNNPLKVSLENIIPLTEARDHFSQIVNEVQKDKLYVLTKGGKPAVAIVDVKYLEAITGGEVNKGNIVQEIKKDPEKVGLPPMVEHKPQPPTPSKPIQSSFQPKPNPTPPPPPPPVAPIPPRPTPPPPPPPPKPVSTPTPPPAPTTPPAPKSQDKSVIETSFSNSDPFRTSGQLKTPPDAINTSPKPAPTIDTLNTNLDQKDEYIDRQSPDDKVNPAQTPANTSASSGEPDDMIID